MLLLQDRFNNSPKPKKKYWSQEETDILKKAVDIYGKKWSKIQKMYPIFKQNGRNQVDLKDKYRNLTSRSKEARKSRKLMYKSKNTKKKITIIDDDDDEDIFSFNSNIYSSDDIPLAQLEKTNKYFKRNTPFVRYNMYSSDDIPLAQLRKSKIYSSDDIPLAQLRKSKIYSSDDMPLVQLRKNNNYLSDDEDDMPLIKLTKSKRNRRKY